MQTINSEENSFFTEQGEAGAQLPQQSLDTTEGDSKWEMHSIKSWEYLSQMPTSFP